MADMMGLSPDQQASLVMFSEVTANAREPSKAVEILKACNWNVEQALQLHWASGDDVPSQARSSATSTATPPLSQPLLPGNHVNEPDLNEYLDGLGFVGKVLRAVGRVIATILSLLSTFIFGSGTPWLGDGQASGALLGNALVSQYGSQLQLPKFFPGSFTQAVQEARKEVKLLVVYLHSEHSRFSQHFCTQVLSNEFNRMLLDENFLLWGGDVANMEAHQVSQMVHARQFPCFCVLLPASVEEIRVIGCVHGDVQNEATVALLTKCLGEMDNHRSEIVARQEQIFEDRDLRHDQDREYQEALEMDRKREEQRQLEMAERKEAERLLEEERSAKESELAKLESERRTVEERRRALASKLLPPGPDATCTVCIRLPTGQRITRKFSPATTLAEMYSWADCLPYLAEHEAKGLVIPPRFMLRTSFPSRDLTEMGSNIQELQLAGAMVLLVEIEDDE